MTALTTTSQLLPWIEMYVPEAPDNLIADALKARMRIFFEQTKCWIDSQEITTVASQAEYTLDPPDGGVIREVVSVTASGATIPIDASCYRYDMTTGEFVFLTPYVPSDADKVWTIKAMCVPEFRADSFPAWILEQFGEAIAAGTAGDLAGLPRRPWTDQRVRDERMAVYWQAVSNAMRLRAADGTDRALGVTPG